MFESSLLLFVVLEDNLYASINLRHEPRYSYFNMINLVVVLVWDGVCHRAFLGITCLTNRETLKFV